MAIEIETVEQLIIDVLKNDIDVKAVVKTFERYDGQFSQEDLKKVLTLLPGCFVTFVRDTLDSSTRGQTYVQKNQFNVVVATKDLRGKFEGKQGAKGAFKITELVHAALHNNELGLANVYPGLERLDRFPVLVTDKIAVYEMSFSIKWTV